jgi:hypothetical protein
MNGKDPFEWSKNFLCKEVWLDENKSNEILLG